MTRAIVTPAGVEAAALFAALHEQCFSNPWDPSAMASLLASPAVDGLLMRSGQAPTGLALVRHLGDAAEILTIGVVPPARRRGAGRALLAAAEALARGRGALRLVLEVSERNAAAAALYARAGYREIARRRRYYRDSADARVLAKTFD